MPIVISHQPSMELLARAGYYIGAGEERQRTEELAQQERSQLRNIEANLISHQLSFQQQMQRDAMQQQYDAARTQAQMEHNAEQQKRQAELKQRLMEIQREDRLEQADRQLRQQTVLNGQRHNNAIELDQMRFLHGQSDDVLKTIRELQASGLEFEDDEARKAYESTLKQLEVIRRDETIRPMQKAQAMFELTSRLQLPRRPAQTFEDYVATSTTKVPDPNHPGQFILLGRDRSGEPRVLVRPQPQGAGANAGQQAADKLQAEKDREDRQLYQDVYKMLTRRDQVNDEMIYPTHEQVVDMMAKIKSANVPPVRVQWDENGNVTEPSLSEAMSVLQRLQSQQGQQQPVRRGKFDPETGEIVFED